MLDHLLAEATMLLLQTDQQIRIIIKKIKLELHQAALKTDNTQALSENHLMFHQVRADQIHQLQEVVVAQEVILVHQVADPRLDQCLHLLEAALQDRLLQAAQEEVLRPTEEEEDK